MGKYNSRATFACLEHRSTRDFFIFFFYTITETTLALLLWNQKNNDLRHRG